MQTLPYLRNGDTIGLTCTARAITAAELEPTISLFESWGFKVKLSSSVGLKAHQFGGSDEERTKSFQDLLDDGAVKAILICRGGYGTVRILDQLDWTNFKEKPKWILGFSDITYLHNQVNQALNIPTLHTSMPSVFETNTKLSLNSIADALKGNPLIYEFAAHKFNRKGVAEAKVIGGNLSILYSLIGTQPDLNTKNTILFIEDLDEYLYHVDRMMISLKRAGKLNNLAALVVGGMSDMNDNSTPFGKTAYQIIQEHISEFDYPVCFDFPAGHIPDNRTLILGKKAKLTIENKVTWKQ